MLSCVDPWRNTARQNSDVNSGIERAVSPINRKEWGLARHKTQCFRGFICDAQSCVIAIHWILQASCKCPIRLSSKLSLTIAWHDLQIYHQLVLLVSSLEIMVISHISTRWRLLDGGTVVTGTGCHSKKSAHVGACCQLNDAYFDLLTQVDKVLFKASWILLPGMFMNLINWIKSCVGNMGSLRNKSDSKALPEHWCLWSDSSGHYRSGPW